MTKYNVKTLEEKAKKLMKTKHLDGRTYVLFLRTLKKITEDWKTYGIVDI